MVEEKLWHRSIRVRFKRISTSTFDKSRRLNRADCSRHRACTVRSTNFALPLLISPMINYALSRPPICNNSDLQLIYPIKIHRVHHLEESPRLTLTINLLLLLLFLPVQLSCRRVPKNKKKKKRGKRVLVLEALLLHLLTIKLTII